ncbi:hypothetical protein E2C01_076037 [Portunus trituberculatus]|uniref:Uncharacterized protein n=1 Tax=Portunus trituberculatus TaxID=210409 RepID=A0A5B7I7P3_PORTR|nr:hypothetical protein [Portunus trituberculatus]
MAFRFFFPFFPSFFIPPSSSSTKTRPSFWHSLLILSHSYIFSSLPVVISFPLLLLFLESALLLITSPVPFLPLPHPPTRHAPFPNTSSVLLPWGPRGSSGSLISPLPITRPPGRLVARRGASPEPPSLHFPGRSEPPPL